MAKFHSLKVSDVRKETAVCVSVAFSVPDNLKSEYAFLPGQYLTLKLFVGGEEIRRSYSICSSPLEGELRVAAKRVKGGKGSNYINDSIKPGDQLEIMTPMGSFHSPISAINKKNYVLFAGGSGITPMLSIIKTVLPSEPGSTIQLFYGNLNNEATIFKKQLDELAEKNKDRLSIYYILDKPADLVPELHQGIMTGEKVKALLTNYVKQGSSNEYFICGPTAMMDNVKNSLESLKVEKASIHIEYFTALVAEAAPKLTTGEKIMSKVTIIMDGRETTIDLASDGKVILDAALDADMDAPFACKGAVCATCRAKVLEGKVRMNQNFALTDGEVKDGFILTCQSHPITEVVVVDYDV